MPTLSQATFLAAATGMAADAQSLAAFGWQLLAGKVVSAESLAAMMATFDDDQYRLGLEDLTGHLGPFVVAVGHGGHRNGYKSVPAVIPDRQTVIVVFNNKTDALVERVANDLNDGDGPARVGDQVDHRAADDGDARLVTHGGLPGPAMDTSSRAASRSPTMVPDTPGQRGRVSSGRSRALVT